MASERSDLTAFITYYYNIGTPLLFFLCVLVDYGLCDSVSLGGVVWFFITIPCAAVAKKKKIRVWSSFSSLGANYMRDIMWKITCKYSWGKYSFYFFICHSYKGKYERKHKLPNVFFFLVCLLET